LVTGEQHGVCGGGVGGVQHGGGVQPQEAGGVGGEQQEPARAATGTAVAASQRPIPTISDIKVDRLAIEWRSLEQSSKRQAGENASNCAVLARFPSGLPLSCNPRAAFAREFSRKSQGRLTLVHSNTELLIDYWRGCRGQRAVPARADIDPAGFARLMPSVFIAERQASGDVVFRLAGEAIVELHGAPLGGASLLALWRPEHRRHLAVALEAALADARPLVVGAVTQQPGGHEPKLELLFAPLSGPKGQIDRFLGLYQLLAGDLAAPLAPLAIANLAGVPLNAEPSRPRLAAVDGRRIA
jgi:hypothetical protein